MGPATELFVSTEDGSAGPPTGLCRDPCFQDKVGQSWALSLDEAGHEKGEGRGSSVDSKTDGALLCPSIQIPEGDTDLQHLSPPSPDLPDDCLLSILSRVRGIKERNAFSLASRHLWELEAASRTRLRLGPGVKAASEALGRLAHRFTNLRSIHFDYLGWKSGSGPQLGDDALSLVVSRCTALTHLSLSFCGFVTDTGMAHVSHCRTLVSLRLNFLPCLTGRGLLSVVLGCPRLEALHVERCTSLRSAEWLEALGTASKREGRYSCPPLSPQTPPPGGRRTDPGPRTPPPAGSTLWDESLEQPERLSITASGSARRSFDSSSLGGFFAQVPGEGCASPPHPQSVHSAGSFGSSGLGSPSASLGSPKTPSPMALSQWAAAGSPMAPLNLTAPSAGPPSTTPPATSPLVHSRPVLSEEPAGAVEFPVGVKKLTVSHCRGIGEGDLAKLGKAGWERLEELQFDNDVHPRDQLLPSVAQFELFASELDLSRLQVLSLSHCPRTRGEGLALVLFRLFSGKKQHRYALQQQEQRDQHRLRVGTLGLEAEPGAELPKDTIVVEQSWDLTELRLESCPGLNDGDVRELLSANASSLRKLSLSLVKWLGGTAVQNQPVGGGAGPFVTEASGVRVVVEQRQQQQPQARDRHHAPHQASTWAVTTASLWYIAEYCRGLEELDLICRDDFPSSAPLFLGFADAAVADIVGSLGNLRQLRVGRGLHLSEALIAQLRRDYPRVNVTIC